MKPERARLPVKVGRKRVTLPFFPSISFAPLLYSPSLFSAHHFFVCLVLHSGERWAVLFTVTS